MIACDVCGRRMPAEQLVECYEDLGIFTGDRPIACKPCVKRGATDTALGVREGSLDDLHAYVNAIYSAHDAGIFDPVMSETLARVACASFAGVRRA